MLCGAAALLLLAWAGSRPSVCDKRPDPTGFLGIAEKAFDDEYTNAWLNFCRFLSQKGSSLVKLQRTPTRGIGEVVRRFSLSERRPPSPATQRRLTSALVLWARAEHKLEQRSRKKDVGTRASLTPPPLPPPAALPTFSFLARHWRKRWEDDPSNCCGPWLCGYWRNAKMDGPPDVVEWRSEVATRWQRKPGYGYGGVAELNNKAPPHAMSCATRKHFTAGVYSFEVFGSGTGFAVSVGGQPVVNAVWPRHGLQGSAYGVQWSATPYDSRVRVAAGMKEVTAATWHDGFLVARDRPAPRRSYFQTTWVKVGEHAKTRAEKTACMVSAGCWPHATCPVRTKEIRAPGEEAWKKVCPAWLQLPRCLVYSFGIRGLYGTEVAYGKMGCEVHAFDCTDDLPANLGPNTVFHSWCVTGSSKGRERSLSLLDGKRVKRRHASDVVLLSMSQIIDRLGHRGRGITVLKMDCEGCEWGVIDRFAKEDPTEWARVGMVLMELHYSHNARKGYLSGLSLSEGAAMYDALSRFSVFHHSVNSDVSEVRDLTQPVRRELVRAGAFNNTCCYEIGLVDVELTARGATTDSAP